MNPSAVRLKRRHREYLFLLLFMLLVLPLTLGTINMWEMEWINCFTFEVCFLWIIKFYFSIWNHRNENFLGKFHLNSSFIMLYARGWKYEEKNEQPWPQKGYNHFYYVTSKIQNNVVVRCISLVIVHNYKNEYSCIRYKFYNYYV